MAREAVNSAQRREKRSSRVGILWSASNTASCSRRETRVGCTLGRQRQLHHQVSVASSDAAPIRMPPATRPRTTGPRLDQTRARNRKMKRSQVREAMVGIRKDSRTSENLRRKTAENCGGGASAPQAGLHPQQFISIVLAGRSSLSRPARSIRRARAMRRQCFHQHRDASAAWSATHSVATTGAG